MFGSDKAIEMVKEIAVLECKLETVTQENERLWKQNKDLSDALIAKESPVAYSQIKADEAALENPLHPSEVERHAEEMKALKQIRDQWYAVENKSFFTDGDDMISTLAGEEVLDNLRSAVGPPEYSSLHGDDES